MAKQFDVAVIGAGVFFALDLASWHIGIQQTRLGNASLFGNAGSIILMIWGLIALRGMLPPSQGIDFLFFGIGGTAWGLPLIPLLRWAERG